MADPTGKRDDTDDEDVTDDDVRRARVGAQLLHRPARPGHAAGVVAALLAVQAQDTGAAPLALRARSPRLTAAAVRTAREDRSVVRVWGPRGTLHLIANDDLDWLVPLLAPARPTGTLRRLAQEGVTGQPDDLVRVTERALRGAGPLTKPELGERLARLGCRAQGQGIVHLASLAAIHGRLVLGPDRGGKPTYVYAEEWLGRPLRPERDRDRALTELARRYLRAHAPAAPEDLAAWSGLPLRDATAAWALVGGELTDVHHRGRPLWRLKKGGARPRIVPVALVPAFDEYLLGWRDRALSVPPVHARRVGPGGGIIHPAVVADGRVVGTWRRTGRRGPEVTLFQDGAASAPPPDLEAALDDELADVVRFTADG